MNDPDQVKRYELKLKSLAVEKEALSDRLIHIIIEEREINKKIFGIRDKNVD